MTIKGLGQLISEVESAWDNVGFDKSGTGAAPIHFVADGSALEWSIYGKIDWKCGGQMTEFANATRKFVEICKKCNIVVHAVFDGVMNPNKIEDQMKRKTMRVREITAVLARQKTTNLDLHLPPLSSSIFMNVLRECGTEIIVADDEAEDGISALARHLDGYILSHNTEFCTLPCGKGFLPLNHFSYDEDGIKCKVFRTVKFCEAIGLAPRMLSWFSVLAGADASRHIVEPFLEKFEVEEVPGQKRRRLLQEVIKFLEPFSTAADQDVALAVAKTAFGDQVADPNFVPNLLAALNKRNDADAAYARLTPMNSVYPMNDKEIIASYRAGLIPSMAVSVMFRRYHICPPVLELGDDNVSAWVVSRPVRCALYALVLPKQEGPAFVKEYLRIGQIFGCQDVVANTVVDNLPTLQAARALQLNEKRALLLKMLGEKDSDVPNLINQFSTTKPEWMIPMLAARLWIRNSQAIQAPVTLAEVVGCALCIIRDLVTDPEPETVTLPEDPEYLPRRSILRRAMEWQCLLHDLTLLNDVLGRPLQPLSPEHSYEGKRWMTVMDRARKSGAAWDEVNDLGSKDSWNENDIENWITNQRSDVKDFKRVFDVITAAGNATRIVELGQESDGDEAAVPESLLGGDYYKSQTAEEKKARAARRARGGARGGKGPLVPRKPRAPKPEQKPDEEGFITTAHGVKAAVAVEKDPTPVAPAVASKNIFDRFGEVTEKPSSDVEEEQEEEAEPEPEPKVEEKPAPVVSKKKSKKDKNAAEEEDFDAIIAQFKVDQPKPAETKTSEQPAASSSGKKKAKSSGAAVLAAHKPATSEHNKQATYTASKEETLKAKVMKKEKKRDAKSV